jgi:polysaccharide chain length determinant protein (PEP-CTERM system associated)
VIISLLAFLPNTYKASAFILVEGQQIPQEYIRSTVTMNVERRLQVISQEILSLSRLAQLADQFGLYPDLREQNVPDYDIASAMHRDIGLQVTARGSGRDGDTVAFEVSYTGPDPQNVVLVANTLASFYIEENQKVRKQQARGTSEFLQVEVEETRKRLEVLEKQIAYYKQQYLGELPEQLQANLNTFTALQRQMEVFSEGLVKAHERRSLLLQQLVAASASAPGDMTNPDALGVLLETRKRSLAELKTRFSDKHPDVIREKQAISALEERLKAQLEPPQTENQKKSSTLSGLSPTQVERAAVDEEIRRLTEDLNKTRSDMAAYQRRIENTPKREQELLSISRDHDSTRELYASLLKRLDEAKLADSLEEHQKAERFRLLEPASYPQELTALKRIYFSILGLVLSLGLAIGAVFLREALDTSFHRIEDLKAFTHARILGIVPQIITEQDRQKGRRQHYLYASILTTVLLLVIGMSRQVAVENEYLVRLLVRPGGEIQLR